MIRNGQFFFSETGKRLIVKVYFECLRCPSMLLLFNCWFTLEVVCLLLQRNFVKKRKGLWRRHIYRKYASCRWLRTQDLNLRADVVLSMSRGPPGQWFPETEYWASAIFVGTSGIPPKIIYRSIKSYTLLQTGKAITYTIRTLLDTELRSIRKCLQSCSHRKNSERKTQIYTDHKTLGDIMKKPLAKSPKILREIRLNI